MLPDSLANDEARNRWQNRMDACTASSGPYVWGSPALCPDLLRLSQLGPADGLRGRVVRGFFRLLEWRPV